MADEDIVAVKVGDTLGERYKLVRAISAGGMGAVFEAENTWTLRRVALKVLQSHLATDPGAVSRFQSEARLASRVAHPNLIDVLDLGRDERTGTLYLITELLAGRDLRDELAARGRFTPRDALDVMVPVMRALGAAHDKGILHRDVKPANVFLARGEGGAVTPKLIDFGVARALDPDGAKHLTTTGAMVGTILYMAPEQVRGDRDIDGRVDIWAVGAVLFELLTGAPPYPPDGHHTLVWKILSGAPPRLATVAPELPRAVTDAVDRALTHDRELRFATMREFIDALTGAHPLDETH
jgi:serine/threonine protein kinase